MRRSKPVCVCLFFYRFPMIKRELLRVFAGGSLKSVRRPMPTFFANQNPQKKHNEKVANPATFPANCELRTANCDGRKTKTEGRKKVRPNAAAPTVAALVSGCCRARLGFWAKCCVWVYVWVFSPWWMGPAAGG